MTQAATKEERKKEHERVVAISSWEINQNLFERRNKKYDVDDDDDTNDARMVFVTSDESPPTAAQPSIH